MRLSFEGNNVGQVTGTLTLLGKTGPVVLKATRFNCFMHPALKREVCGGDFETTIRRSLWGRPTACPVSPTTCACWFRSRRSSSSKSEFAASKKTGRLAAGPLHFRPFVQKS